MGFKLQSIEELIRSANNDLIKLQSEISYIKSVDADKLFLSGKYSDVVQFYGTPTKNDLEEARIILLESKLKDEEHLKDVLSNQTVRLRDQKLDDLL